jgi:hypothetical protein
MDHYQWNVPLDRITDFSTVSNKKPKTNPTNWNAFFQQMIGVTLKSETQPTPIIEKVVLKFNPDRLPYFVSKPLHPL